jgi:tRNA-Thr(GGU) m(6)t(6)A37 methyltransferase TsaA
MASEPPSLLLRPIGVIHSPHREAAGTPIQSVYAEASEGEVVVDPEFAPALADIEGFERLWLLYVLDRAGAYRPRVMPYRDTVEHGLFATRSPCRPNPIGLSVVRLLGREGNRLRVAGLDILDETPLLDIKPYVPEFDAFPGAKAGWLEARRSERERADGRFHGEVEP